jgi:hypothetical protein
MKHDLTYWQDWVSRQESAYGDQLSRMDHREALYRGEVREIEPLTAKDRAKDGSYRKTAHLRNIIAENIESEVNSVIPQPKVTARRKADEGRAKILEDMLRNELDRLPMEELNDQAERTIPIQGGAFWLVEWDNSARTHSTVGDVAVTLLHPKQVIPQNGVFGRVEDMDAIALRLPQTRAGIKARYGKDVDEGEEKPEVRTLGSEAAEAEDLVTQYVVYYRGECGKIGKLSWVNDTVLEDLEDYAARKLRRCEQCGRPEPDRSVKTCPECGGRLTERAEEVEEIISPITTPLGEQIGGQPVMQETPAGPVVRIQPAELPYYHPDCFPVFLQRNVSLFGQLLGDSDVDKIEDQQNTVSRMETKMIDRLIKAGTRITLPDRADFRNDPEDGERWFIGNPADKAAIGLFQFSGDLQYEMAYLAQVYEEARQALGITDSFQGRRDTTAQSGVAKQFAAQQSAGRLESKRVLKEAAYAELFKRIVQLKVAYADEPRPVVAEDNRGAAQYEEFSRYDFYERDAAGKWHCILDDDRFLFSCDTSAPLAANRPQMWQEMTQMLQLGAFGSPQDPQTLLMYWTEMEKLHYPNASDAREFMEQRIRAMQQEQAAQQQAAMEAQQRQAALEAEQRDYDRGRAEQQAALEAQRAAMEDARRDAMMGRARPTA